MWIGSNGLTATRCPVIDLAAHRETLASFDACYEPVVEPMSGYAHYRRIALPYSGGVHDQPARLMAALAFLEDVAREELQEDIDDHRRRQATTKKPVDG